MKIVDMMEEIFKMRTFKDRINVISKSLLKFWRVQYVHKPAYKFLLWLKILDLPLQRHEFVGKTDNGVPKGC